MMNCRLIVILLLSYAAAARAQSTDQPTSDGGDRQFFDATEQLISGLANTNSCWADVNGDGWPDLCADKLWINAHPDGFRESEQAVGSVVAADCDNDGDLDLFSWSQRQLWLNQGDGRFAVAPLPDLPASVSRGAVWGDFNLDGFVDLYIAGYEDWNAGLTYPDLLLINQQGKTFTLDWQYDKLRARGVTACDFDEDGDLDVYVSNYRLQPNLLWLNRGNASFEDGAQARNVVATSEGFSGGHSIGAAWGDFNNDGRFDLFAGNFAHVDSRGDQPKSRFLKQIQGDDGPTFGDLGPCGIRYQESYATPAAADMDNDGDLDLFFTTVYGTASFGRPNAPVLYDNRGDFSFEDMTEQSGLAGLPPTYQAAWADFDRDGDMDLVAGGRLFENRTSEQHWLEITLAGDGKHVNRSAIGAQVRITAGDQTLTRQVEAGTGEGNQNDLTMHFGLGSHAQPVDLTILWPGGETASLSDLSVDHAYTFVFGETQANPMR